MNKYQRILKSKIIPIVATVLVISLSGCGEDVTNGKASQISAVSQTHSVSQCASSGLETGSQKVASSEAAKKTESTVTENSSSAFDENCIFHDGLCLVQKDGKAGFINKKGETVIDFKYLGAAEFINGKALVTVDGKTTFYINTKGETLGEAPFPSYEMKGYFHEGLAQVEIAGKEGYMNTDLEIAIQPKFDETYPFSDGMALIDQGNEEHEDWYGYIDKTGEFVIEPQFEDAEAFSEGLASVRVDGKWGYINKKGEIVIKPQFERAEAFSDGLARIGVSSNGGYDWGYIDKTGNWVLEPGYNSAEDFSEGLAIIGGNCVIDKEGNVLFQLKGNGEKYVNGMVKIMLDNGNTAFADKSGKIVFELPYNEVTDFSNDGYIIAITYQDYEKDIEKYSIFNKSGKAIASDLDRLSSVRMRETVFSFY